MARVKSWYTAVGVSSSSMGSNAVGQVEITGPLVDPTLLRLRAWAELSTENDNVPPIYPGNSLSPYVLRVLATDVGGIPPDLWWDDASGQDDMIFSSFNWSDFLLVPADALAGNPREIFATARLEGAVADSHGMRKFPGTQHVVLSFYMGPILGTGQVADPQFTARWWFRALIEATV